MKFGMNLLLWTGGVTEEHYPLLNSIRQWGFDGVEVPLFAEEDANLRKTARALENAGLSRTAVCVCTPEANPIDPDPTVRRAGLDHIKERIDWSAILGVEILCGPFHSALGKMVGRGRTTEEWGWCVEVLREAAEYAGKAGVKLSVEPLNRFEVYFLNTAEDANRLVAEVGHPNLGYLYDSFHANIEERNVYRSVAANFAGINHVHISENHRGIPGDGHVHWDDTFRALKQNGYDGWLTIEAFGRRLPELAAATCIWRDLFPAEEDVAVRGLEFMRAKWREA
jgi:D-psicose/D-tagatose/L-ribulose 3-epimerase